MRFSEALLANCIAFISQEFDMQYKIYPNEKFLYVKSGKELEEKILFLKNNLKEYKRLIEVQHKKVEEMRRHNFAKMLNDSLMEN